MRRVRRRQSAADRRARQSAKRVYDIDPPRVATSRERAPAFGRHDRKQSYRPEMAWLFILSADLFEIAWPFALKWSAPMSRWAPLIVVLVFAIPANFLLAEAVKRLPAATVYATFVGIGTAGTAIVGAVFFRESVDLRRVCSLILIIIGVIGLRLFSGAAD